MSELNDAHKLRDLLNSGVEPETAVERIGYDPEAVTTEHEGLALYDADNDVIDLCNGALVRRYGGEWHAETYGPEDVFERLRERVAHVTPAANDELARSLIQAHNDSDTEDRWMSMAVIALARLMARKAGNVNA